MNLSTAFGWLWSVLPEPVKRTYRCVPLGVRQFFYDRLLTGKATIVVRSGLARNMRMVVRPRMEMGFYLGNYELEVQEVLARFVKPGMTVFNIGANVGFLSLGLAQLVGPKGGVVAFEPNPTAIDRLRVNIALNKLQAVVSIHQLAIADFDGQASFSLARTEMQGRFSDLPYIPQDASTISVTCTTLDTFCDTTGLVPEMLVIDVEHAEGRVLRGMRRLLQKRKPLIIIEMHGQTAIAEAYREFLDQGYHLFSTEGLKPVGSVVDIRMLGHYVASPMPLQGI